MGWGRDESLCLLAGRCWRHPRTPFFSLEASFVCPFLLRAPKTGHLIGGSSSVPASLYFTHYHFGCIDRGGCFAALSLMFAFGGSLARTNALPLCNVWWMLCHWCLLRAWQTLCHRSSTLADALPSWSCCGRAIRWMLHHRFVLRACSPLASLAIVYPRCASSPLRVVFV